MKYLLIFLVFFGTSNFYAQKETIKEIDASEIEVIHLSTEEVYKIDISTIPGNTVRIKTISEGEYYNDIGLETEVKGNSLFITSKFREKLQGGFDKLSAHKVFALKLSLEIPENLSVDILSNLAAVYGSGDYKSFVVQLKNGSCYLKDFNGNAIINTFGGNIKIETENSRIEANSRNGNIQLPKFTGGDNLIKIKTINGNITVRE